MIANKWCDQIAPYHIELLKELAAVPSPSHHEERRAEFIMDWLSKHGVHNAYLDEAKNVYFPIDIDIPKPMHVYAAHTDVVFCDETALPVSEDSDKIYAPGVGDDTANVVALMLIIQYIQEMKLKPKLPVMFLFNSCEEGLGNLEGTRTFMNKWKDKVSEFISFDGQTTKIVNRAVGSERWKIGVHSEGGHSFGKFGNQSAIHQISRIILNLYQQQILEKEGTKTTYNVGTVSGGTSVNSIAEYAEMTYEYRSDDEECIKQMKSNFLSIIEEFCAEGLEVKIELIGVRPCMQYVDPLLHEALLKKCSDLIFQQTGNYPILGSSSTDANIPLSFGIPSTTFGLYTGDRSHTREEWVLKESLTVGLKIGLNVVLNDFSDD